MSGHKAGKAPSSETFIANLKADVLAANAKGEVAQEAVGAAGDLADSLTSLFELGSHIAEGGDTNPIETAKFAISALEQLANTVASFATAITAIAPAAGLVTLPAYALVGLLKVVGTILNFVQSGKVVTAEDEIVDRVKVLLDTQAAKDRISNIKDTVDEVNFRIDVIQSLKKQLLLDPDHTRGTAPTQSELKEALFPRDMTKLDVSWGVRDFLKDNATTTESKMAQLVAKLVAYFVGSTFVFQTYVQQLVSMASCV